jgi:hypothetical protein
MLNLAEALEQFAAFLTENKNATYDDVCLRASELELSESKLIPVYVQSMFDDNIEKQLGSKTALLSKVRFINSGER